MNCTAAISSGLAGRLPPQDAVTSAERPPRSVLACRGRRSAASRRLPSCLDRSGEDCPRPRRRASAKRLDDCRIDLRQRVRCPPQILMREVGEDVLLDSAKAPRRAAAQPLVHPVDAVAMPQAVQRTGDQRDLEFSKPRSRGIRNHLRVGVAALCADPHRRSAPARRAGSWRRSSTSPVEWRRTAPGSCGSIESVPWITSTSLRWWYGIPYMKLKRLHSALIFRTAHRRGAARP